MKDTINILFVCGYGVGSSVMLQTVVKKALTKYEFKVEMEHTAAGEVGALPIGRIFCYFQKITRRGQPGPKTRAISDSD